MDRRRADVALGGRHAGRDGRRARPGRGSVPGGPGVRAAGASRSRLWNRMRVPFVAPDTRWRRPRVPVYGFREPYFEFDLPAHWVSDFVGVGTIQVWVTQLCLARRN